MCLVPRMPSYFFQLLYFSHLPLCNFSFYVLIFVILYFLSSFIELFSWICWGTEGNGIPLQYYCLENPMDGGTWWAAAHGVAKSWTRLSDFTFTFHFHALEKEMATQSSVLAWRIPGSLVGSLSLVGWAWWAAIYGAAQSWTRLKRLSSSIQHILLKNFCSLQLLFFKVVFYIYLCAVYGFQYFCLFFSFAYSILNSKTSN